MRTDLRRQAIGTRRVRAWFVRLSAFTACCCLAGVPLWAADPEPPAQDNPPAQAEGAKAEGESAAKAEAEKAAEPAAEATAPAALTPEQLFEGGSKAYPNWVEISAGGMIAHGDRANAEQRQQLNRGFYGGIESLHFQQDLDKKTVFTLDGHSIFGQDDYSLTLGLRREDAGYVRFSFENFRTWYDTSGGYWPPAGQQLELSDDAFTLDRGEISFEAGLTLKNLPRATFKYTHRYRDGQKDSTRWGPLQTTAGLRGLVPALYNIDEESDIFSLDLAYRYRKTDLGAGVRYETGELDDTYKAVFRPGEPVRRALTEKQGTSYDLFSVHAFTETWLRTNLFFSTAFEFANLNNDFTGSRIFGDDFDVVFVPNALNTLGYFDLNGGSERQEYVAGLNLLAIPAPFFTIVPSFRVQYEDWSADSSGMGTQGLAAPEPFRADSTREQLDVRERVELRYNGITNWVFYAGPEFLQGTGNLFERGGLSRVNNIGPAPVIAETDDTRFFQKYFAGVRWYPTSRVTIDVNGYYKRNEYDYDHLQDSTSNALTSSDRYPAFLDVQSFDTYDGSVRLTVRPLRNVTLVGRYEYQYSTVETQPAGLDEVESSRMTTHIVGLNASWTPFSRLSLQAGVNYVDSETDTPTSEYTEAVLDSQNSYWTANANAGIVLDNRTDLNLGYFHYLSDNFNNNANVGLPLGAASREHGVTASLVRRLSERVRWMVRYGFSSFEDQASGGHDSFRAHLVYSSLQYRF